jgi:hypothetical protein
MIGVKRSRHRGLLAAFALAAILGCAFAAPASAATPAPAWSIRSLAVPTNFKPGDESGLYQYELMIVNGGGAATDGSPIALTDTLPAGLTIKAVRLLLSTESGEADFASSLCETEKPAESEIVRCTIPGEVAGAPDPTLLGPSEALRLVIRVSTPLGAAGTTLTNVAEVQGGGAPAASTASHNQASSEPAPSGFMQFSADLLGIDGLPAREAASHPYQYRTSLAVNTEDAPFATEALFFNPAGGDVKDVRVVLPPGLVGDPTAISRCTAQQFNTTHAIQPFGGAVVTINECPDGSAVGLVLVQQLEGRGRTLPVPLYNLVAPKGMPAQLGFQVLGSPFYIDTALRTGGDYGVTASLRNTTQIQRVTAADVVVWGVPSHPRHNQLRGSCLNSSGGRPMSLGTCPAGLVVEPFLRLPTSCEKQLTTQMSFDTWTNRGSFVSAVSTEPAPVNCAPLDFSPTVSVVPHVTIADSPTGLRFNLHLPQNSDPNLLAEADLRAAVVTLPEGVTVNPASANGLAACRPAQVSLSSSQPAQCPDASKIGSVEIHTPLVDHPVKGAVYVASQNDNPFNSLLAIYIAVDDPQTGIVVKLAGHVVPDPSTGRLTTRFDDNPQLPFEDFTVEFFDGPRAPLRTPGTCGTYTTTTDLRPWSAPESGPGATPSDSFAVSTAPTGEPCAASEGAQPHRPGFSAGTLAPIAGSFSPVVTNLRREDGSQVLRGLNVALPQGLVGKLAGVPYCPESAIAAAAGRIGGAERADPSCPAASQVGTATVGAGAGPSPIHVQGKAYLAGPYRGAPLSLAVVTPAVAGPFDLGTVVVRAALHVDPRTAQVRVMSDPIPTILQGIPLDVRSISVDADRRDFTLNPTNCEPMAVSGEAISLPGQVAPLSSRFQVGGCRGLDFAPQLALRLRGATRRTGNPELIATLTAKGGEANIARAAVKLPRSSFLDQSHIRTVCTRVQFAADACPKGSIYGRATATSPLLDYPLAGNVYLRSSSNELPDLVVDLRGPAHQPIRIEVAGRTDSVRASLRNTFDFVPDVPVSKFRLRLFGGKRGLIVNSRNICSRAYFATARFKGQNGKKADLRPRIKNDCGKKGSRKHKR